MRTIRTLLSGGELFGVGARAAGFTHVDGFEIDDKIAAVARLNGFNVHTADICNVDYGSLPAVDHLHASTVCTRASQANVGAVETSEDLRMADAVCRAIRAHQGRTFTLENVWTYRNFESFARILSALLESAFVYDFAHVNAADYGVPQTRKRLILRAVRGRDRVPPLHPTHRKGGDMFHPPWVGWYSAIADILHTLPETTPAPWQLARMPEKLRESTLFPSRMSHDHEGNCYGPQSRGADEPALTLSTMTPGWYRAYLIGAGGWDGEVVNREEDEPAFTMTSTDNSQQLRAFLIGDQSGSEGEGVQLVGPDDPAMTVRSGRGGGAPRAYIVGGGNTQLSQVDSHARADDEPYFTVSASDGSKKTAAAFLIDSKNAGQEWAKGYRDGDEPAFTCTTDHKESHQPRAYTAGRWVRMTVQALGRFQTVPDDYQALTAQINGNGVPCLLAQRIMESLQ